VQDITEEAVEDANILETLLGVLSDSFFEALDPTDQTGVIDIERISIRSEAAALLSNFCSTLPHIACTSLCAAVRLRHVRARCTLTRYCSADQCHTSLRPSIRTLHCVQIAPLANQLWLDTSPPELRWIDVVMSMAALDAT